MAGKRVYEPYGKKLPGLSTWNLTDIGVPEPAYGFAGQRWDDEAQAYLMGARWYDVEMGRFLELDPIGAEGGLNPYAYANASPTLWVDPSGLRGNRIMTGGLPRGLRGLARYGAGSPAGRRRGSLIGGIDKRTGRAVIQGMNPEWVNAQEVDAPESEGDDGSTDSDAETPEGQGDAEAEGRQGETNDLGDLTSEQACDGAQRRREARYLQVITKYFTPTMGRPGSEPAPPPPGDRSEPDAFTPAPEDLIGTCEYYRYRFSATTPEYKQGNGPEYLMGWAYRMCYAFEDLARDPDTSSDLRTFIYNAMTNLQESAEEVISQDQKLQGNRVELQKALIDTHDQAYRDAGFRGLSYQDRAKVLRLGIPEALRSWSGAREAFDGLDLLLP